MKNAVLKRVMQVLSVLVLESLLLFFAAGTVNWLWGCVWLAANAAVIGVNALFLPKEVIAERGSKKENAKSWDRVISWFIGIPMLAAFVVSGLDYRFNWTSGVGIWFNLTGLVLTIAGYTVLMWAMRTNTYFSTLVRIQSERGHKVISAGPYAVVRHPGYVGMIVYTFALPLLLGSVYGLVPALLTAIFMVIRTAKEDSTLKAELEGYAEYSSRVRWKLLPGVW